MKLAIKLGNCLHKSLDLRFIFKLNVQFELKTYIKRVKVGDGR